MRFSGRKLGLLVATAVTVSAAACSSSGGTSNTASSGSSVKPGSTIVIAGEGSLLGFSGAQDGVNARLARANKNGGINGHQIKSIGITDSGTSADTSLSNLRELVQRKNVDAIVPEFPSNMPPAAAAFLEQQKVPYIGLGYETSMCNNTAGFPFNGCNVPGVATNQQPALVKDLPKIFGTKDLTGKTIAVIGGSAPGGAAFVKEIGDRATDIGAKVVYSAAEVPQGSTNVQAFVDPVLQAKPDMVYVVTDLVADSAIQGTLLANGYKGALINAAAYLPGVLDAAPELQKALNGSWVVSVTPTPLDNSPVSKQMEADFKAVNGKITFGSLIAYMATDLYVAMLQKAGGDPAKVISVGATFHWDQGQGGYTTTFPAARSQTTQCTGMVRLLSGKYSSVTPFTCI